MNAAQTTFAPDGRSLCRPCYGHLQSAQADARALEGYGGAALAPLGKAVARNPRAMIGFLKLAIVGGFVFLMVSVALAIAVGEGLRNMLGR